MKTIIQNLTLFTLSFCALKTFTDAAEGARSKIDTAPGKRELYDLQSDIGESTNLLPAKKAEAEKLTAALAAWDKEMIPPAFPGATAYQKPNKAKNKADAGLGKE